MRKRRSLLVEVAMVRNQILATYSPKNGVLIIFFLASRVFCALESNKDS